MTNWEYRTVTVQDQDTTINLWNGHTYQQTTLSDAELAQYGRQGWELVSIMRLAQTAGTAEYGWATQYVFKRPKAA